MLVKREYYRLHVIILARNGTIPDKTSCWPTGFIKTANYLYLTEKVLVPWYQSVKVNPMDHSAGNI